MEDFKRRQLMAPKWGFGAVSREVEHTGGNSKWGGWYEESYRGRKEHTRFYIMSKLLRLNSIV